MATPLALYFGCIREPGHYLHDKQSRWVQPDAVECPWDLGLMDGGLLNNRRVSAAPDGRVHWVCGGRPLWHAFVWWDRSVDRRGNVFVLAHKYSRRGLEQRDL